MNVLVILHSAEENKRVIFLTRPTRKIKGKDVQTYIEEEDELIMEC